jgi:hypothetical protein
MTTTDLRAARAMYDTVREGTYWQAGALNATYADTREVVRLWREIGHLLNTRAQVPHKLRVALDALADGWPERAA